MTGLPDLQRLRELSMTIGTNQSHYTTPMTIVPWSKQSDCSFIYTAVSAPFGAPVQIR